MALRLGDEAPNFQAETTEGNIDFHEWIGDSWCVLFSHPADFTPVCTTEIGRLALKYEWFTQRDVKVATLSVDPVDSHNTWLKDVVAHCENGITIDFPIIADADRTISTKYGMLDPANLDDQSLPLTIRAVFIIGPDKKLKLQILYPATTGRNFHEVLRVIDSLQLTANHSVFARAHRLPDLSVWHGVSPRAPLPLSVGRRALRAGAPCHHKAYSEFMRNARFQVATPANWTDGGNCMVVPSLTDEQVSRAFVFLSILCRERV